MAHDKGPLYRCMFAVCFWHTANSRPPVVHYIQFVQPMCVSLSHTNKYIYKAIPKTLPSLSLQTFIMQFLFKSDLYFIPHYIRLLDSFEVCHMPSISLRIHLLYHRDLISPCMLTFLIINRFNWFFIWWIWSKWKPKTCQLYLCLISVCLYLGKWWIPWFGSPKQSAIDYSCCMFQD